MGRGLENHKAYECIERAISAWELGVGQPFFVTSKSNGAHECVGANTQVYVCVFTGEEEQESEWERNRQTGQYFQKPKEFNDNLKT